MVAKGLMQQELIQNQAQKIPIELTDEVGTSEENLTVLSPLSGHGGLVVNPVALRLAKKNSMEFWLF